MEETNLLDIIIKQQSWEDLIHRIVTLEGLDPWDVDLKKLTDSFLKYTKKMTILDFRIPAKVVLVAAILLKLKSEILQPTRRIESSEFFLGNSDLGTANFDDIKKRLSQWQLKPVIEPTIKRKVTLDELVEALRKAVKVEEKKEEKKQKLGRRIRKEIDVKEEDIEKRINDLMFEINSFLLKLGSEKVEFSKLIDVWEKDQIVRYFLPLLHLSTRGDIKVEQTKMFDEIFVKKM